MYYDECDGTKAARTCRRSIGREREVRKNRWRQAAKKVLLIGCLSSTCMGREREVRNRGGNSTDDSR